MASEESLCSPLLERIRRLQQRRQQCRLISSDISLDAQLLSKEGSDSPHLTNCRVTSNHNPSPNPRFLSQDVSSNPGRLNPTCKVFSEAKQSTSNDVKQSCDKAAYSYEIERYDYQHELQDTCGVFDMKPGSSLKNKFDQESTLQKSSSTDPDEKRSGFRFPYLRKGQGTARYKTSVFKGFKKSEIKSSSSKSDLELKIASPVPDHELVHPQERAHEKDVTPKLSAFEKLEVLVEQDSFCSTSSKVVELLQNDSHCSSPLLHKGPLPSLQLTPIAKERRTLSKDEGHAHDPDGNRSEVIKSSQLGILRKRYPNALSPSDLKVKFLDQGVEVLEYDEDECEQDFASNDSDLISVSDLENLALLGCNVKVVQKNKSCRTGSSYSQFYPMFSSTAILNTHFQPKSEGNKNDMVRPQTRQMTSPTDAFAASSSNEVNQKTETSQHVTKFSQRKTTKDDLEVNSHKALLLSKVNDLSKEINIFRNKNKALEELATDLQKEKKNLIERQTDPPEPQQKEKPNPKRKIELDRRNQSSRSDASSHIIVSAKLQDLSEKLLKLEIENINLKRKLNGLEKREREAIKHLNEPENRHKGTKENLKVTQNKKVHGLHTKIKPGGGISSKIVTKTATQPIRPIGMASDKTDIKCSPTPSDEFQNSISPEMKMSHIQESGNGTALKFPDQQSKENKVPCNWKTSSEHPCGSEHSDGTRRIGVTIIENPALLTGQKFPLAERNRQSPTSTSYGNERYPDEAKTRVENPPISYKRDSLEIVDVQAQNVTDVGTEMRADDSVVSISRYPNGDKKTVLGDKTVIHYAKDDVIHTIFQQEGTEEISFANGQREIYFKDGSYQLIFPDSSSKSVYRDGTEVCVWKDGTVIQRNTNGTKSVHFPNGQKEIYEDDNIRRVYPDGTIKVLHADGSQETRYSNGRIRFKDRGGKVSLRRMLTMES